MALIKETLNKSIYSGLYTIFSRQAAKAASGSESEDPEDVIKQVAADMAKVISDSVDAYIKSGDVTVGPLNVQVTSTAPGSIAVVAPLKPAKIT